MTTTTVTQTNPLLEVRDIVKTYGGVTALAGVSLTLGQGEVLCLAGENGCGKSTLIKIISGAERPDSGEILVDGERFTAMDPTVAIKAGIQVIYQDFSLFPNLTVAENVALTSAVAGRRRLYDRAAAHARAQDVVADLGLALDLDADVENLSVADKQLTAICRALANDARVIIMDEPTTALTHTEVDRLFEIVERLRNRGVGLIFVSHKLDEVMAIAQRVTILRSGKHVITGPTSDFDPRTISQHMTGRELDESRHVSELSPEAGVVLEVEDLGLAGAYEDVSFTLRRGEILGVTGLLGSGRTEIAEALFGVLPHDRGTVRVDGAEVQIHSIRDAIDAGIGYVPEDRLTQGLFLEASIADNLVAGSLDRHRTKWSTLDARAVRGTIDRLFKRLRIKAPSVQAPVRSLSGGNAQRVVLAKWLARQPKVLILNGPTVGVDVGSKAEILDILRAEAAGGRGVIVISDDAPELVACCHRVIVVRHGRIVDVLDGDAVTVDVIREKVAA
jgi:simple sugar transport system ATP-binding protein